MNLADNLLETMTQEIGITEEMFSMAAKRGLEDQKDNKKYFEQLIAFNNIFGSLVGLIDGKVNNNELENCKKYILKYYESTYPERQLEAIDSALYSKDCYEYIKYAEKHLIIDKIDLELLKEFSLAYIKGYNLSREVTLKSVLSYYTKKIYFFQGFFQNIYYKLLQFSTYKLFVKMFTEL